MKVWEIAPHGVVNIAPFVPVCIHCDWSSTTHKIDIKNVHGKVFMPEKSCKHAPNLDSLSNLSMSTHDNDCAHCVGKSIECDLEKKWMSCLLFQLCISIAT